MADENRAETDHIEESSVPNPPAGGAPPAAPGMREDIAKILDTVKLPERRMAPKPVAPPIVNKAAAIDTAAPAPEAPAPEVSSVLPVHTLKDDLQHVVHDKKISLVRAVSLEEDRKYREEETPSEIPGSIWHKRLPILFGALILVMLGAAALFGVYRVQRGQSQQTPTQVSSSILFAEAEVALPIDNQSPNNLKQVLLGARNSSAGALGSITRIVPTLIATTSAGGGVRNATFGEFMHALGTNVPDELIRAVADDFFFGIHVVDKNAPLLIVPVTSYDHAFAGMLAWEGTINADLAPVFTAVPSLTKDQSGLPVERTFSDLVMRNYDVRTLKDDAGTIELYYSFPTQNLLIIAESPYTFTEVLSRLQAERKL